MYGSRFDYDEPDEPWQYALWAGAARAALHSQRGRAALTEIRDALLALPVKRLISGRVCYEGEICVLGALALKREMDRGVERAVALVELEEKTSEYESSDTVHLGVELGLTRTLAWEVASRNDDGFLFATSPEQLYDQMLAWLNRLLAEPPLQRAKAPVLSPTT